MGGVGWSQGQGPVLATDAIGLGLIEPRGREVDDPIELRRRKDAGQQGDVGLDGVERPLAIVARQARAVEDPAEIAREDIGVAPRGGVDGVAGAPQAFGEAAADEPGRADDGVGGHAPSPRVPTRLAGAPA
jgi:hypothetical protein